MPRYKVTGRKIIPERLPPPSLLPLSLPPSPVWNSTAKLIVENDDFSRDRERVMILIEIKFKFQEEMWNGGKKFVSFSYFNGFFIIVI